MIDSNIMLNSDVLASTGGLAVSFPLCWGSTDLEGVPESWRHPDLIVAADVIYHKHLFQPLLQTLKTYGEGSMLSVQDFERCKIVNANHQLYDLASKAMPGLMRGRDRTIGIGFVCG